MAQDIYYNDIIAQLVELRNKIGEGGGGTIDTSKLEAKLDEVIKAVKEIKVSTDSISVEAGTINLSTDELEGLLKTVNTNLGIINDNINEFDTNTQTKVAAVIKSIEDNIYTLVTSVNFEGNHNRNNLYNIAKLLGEEIPDDGTEFVPKTTLVKLLTELKAMSEYNSDSNFKSSQALTLSTDGKGIADITNELGEYLKNVIGFKDEDIGNLYELISNIDNSALSIKSIVNVIKTLTQSSTNNISIIQGILGNTINPNDGTVLKLLNELKTLIAPNSDVTVDTVISKLKDIMTNDTVIANAQITVGNNQHTELLDAINNGTLSTYLQNIVGIKPDNGDSTYDLIDSINDAANDTVGRLSGRTFIPASFNRFTVQDALIYLITAIGKGGTSDDPQNVDNTIIGKLKELSSIKSSLIDNADGTVVDYTSSIDVNTANVDVSLGKPTDTSNIVGSIHAKLRTFIEMFANGIVAIGQSITTQTDQINIAISSQTDAIVGAINNIGGQTSTMQLSYKETLTFNIDKGNVIPMIDEKLFIYYNISLSTMPYDIDLVQASTKITDITNLIDIYYNKNGYIAPDYDIAFVDKDNNPIKLTNVPYFPFNDLSGDVSIGYLGSIDITNIDVINVKLHKDTPPQPIMKSNFTFEIKTTNFVPTKVEGVSMINESLDNNFPLIMYLQESTYTNDTYSIIDMYYYVDESTFAEPSSYNIFITDKDNSILPLKNNPYYSIDKAEYMKNGYFGTVDVTNIDKMIINFEKK